MELLTARLDGTRLHDLGELGFERVHKERVYHLVDVFDAGVVHAARAARVGVEGAFEYGAEYRGADVRPVEGRAVVHNHADYFRREVRDFNFFVFEEAAVHVGERANRLVVSVAVFGPGVEGFEEIDEGEADVLDVEGADVVFEGGARRE